MTSLDLIAIPVTCLNAEIIPARGLLLHDCEFCTGHALHVDLRSWYKVRNATTYKKVGEAQLNQKRDTSQAKKEQKNQLCTHLTEQQDPATWSPEL